MLAGLMQNGIENRLKESSINVNDETVKKLSNDITQKVAEIAILSRSVSVEEQQVQINKKLAEFNTDWKNIIGKEAIETISGLIKNLPFAGLLKNVFKGEKTKETYTTKSGHEVSLPIYWRNKIYTEEEREKLWIEKLNKETRYVMGEKVNISKGTEEYEKLLKYHQKRNEELGYKTIEGDEQRKLYERNQRMLQQITRIKKGKAKLEKKSRK